MAIISYMDKFLICDWILENRSKLHISKYEIFKKVVFGKIHGCCFIALIDRYILKVLCHIKLKVEIAVVS